MSEFKKFMENINKPDYDVALPSGLRDALLQVEFEYSSAQPGRMAALYNDIVPLTHVEHDEKVLQHTVAQYRKYYRELIPIVEAKAAEYCKNHLGTSLVVEPDKYERFANQLVQWSEEVMGGSIQFSPYLNKQPITTNDVGQGDKQVCLQFKFGIFLSSAHDFATLIAIVEVSAWETDAEDPSKTNYKQTLASIYE